MSHNLANWQGMSVPQDFSHILLISWIARMSERAGKEIDDNNVDCDDVDDEDDKDAEMGQIKEGKKWTSFIRKLCE